jgi:membrane protein DedA with SNARE-associated domain
MMTLKTNLNLMLFIISTLIYCSLCLLTGKSIGKVIRKFIDKRTVTLKDLLFIVIVLLFTVASWFLIIHLSKNL